MATIKTYWNNNRHEDNPEMQTRLDRLSAEVPSSGSADHAAVDCWREVQNIYYDLFNNGACNLVEPRSLYRTIDECSDNELDFGGLNCRMEAVNKFMGEDSWECEGLREAAILCVRNFDEFCNGDRSYYIEMCIDSILNDCFCSRFEDEVTA